MGIPKTVFSTFLFSALPVLGVILVLFLANFFLTRKFGDTTESIARKQLTMLLVILFGLIFLIATLPLAEALKFKILGLCGLLIGAALALSLIRFFANFLAGSWLKSTGGFHRGDFIHILDHSGTVIGRGLFHTEIRREDGDLVTLPNLLLITRLVQVRSASHPVVAAEISVGYQFPRQKIEDLLILAADSLQLTDISVEIVGLCHSFVRYRIKGLAPQIGEQPLAPSRLKAQILDGLQRQGIEVVSSGKG